MTREDPVSQTAEEFWRGRCEACAHPEHEMTCREMVPNGDPSNGPAYCPCAIQIENMEREIVRLRALAASPADGKGVDVNVAPMLDDELRRVQAGIATPESIARARDTFARITRTR